MLPGTFFSVQFDRDVQIPEGFIKSHFYPVYGIDTYSIDTPNEIEVDGKTITDFLLSDSHGKFHWINSDLVHLYRVTHTNALSHGAAR